MPKLEVAQQKTLKLTNVLIRDVPLESLNEIPLVVEQMENFIKTKGFQPIGPLVQYNAVIGEGENTSIVLRLMRQSDGYITCMDKQYTMEAVLRVPNCLYVRYKGVNEKLQFAYNKLRLTAFEEEIALKGVIYTLFVREDYDTVIADVFMPQVDE